jgi:hypothetical protein
MAALCIACATPRTKVPPAPDGNYAFRRYADLQPGWRIRVVTPILKSGKYKPEFKETGATGNTVELSGGDDLVGYETSYYSVRPGKSGVVIAFVSAANTINGKTARKPSPLVRLFDFPAGTRYVRLVFLTRVSRADHNQAILAAANLDELNRLTDKVETDPAANCKSLGESYCTWVPEGIAVRPEKRDPDHRNNYVPAT